MVWLRSIKSSRSMYSYGITATTTFSLETLKFIQIRPMAVMIVLLTFC